MELTNPLGRWVKREYFIVSLLWVIGFVFYLWILTRHPLIYGIDGPYYLIQVRSSARASGEANPIFFLLDPRGGGFILPVLAVGVVLAVYEWKMKNKEAFLWLVVVAAIGFMLSLPFIPPEWLWRFLLMEFIPTAFILGYSVSKMERKVTTVIFLIIVIFPIVIQGVEASKLMGPTIDEEGYGELVAIRGVIPSNSVVVVEPRLMYWVEYVVRCNTVRRPSPTLWQSYTHVLALFQKTPQSPKPPPGRIIFDRDLFLLVELPRVPV